MSFPSYRLAIRSAIRGLWVGEFTTFGFVDTMQSTLERELRQAWNEGAKECGIVEDELTDSEVQVRQIFISSQFQYLPGVAQFVEENDKASGGLLRSSLARSELWINRYEEAKQRAKSMACTDKKLKWQLGAAEHCRSCLKLNGKVKRASFWNERGILPRTAGASYLQCHGYRCQCSLVETSDSVSKGPLPRLP